MSKTWFSFFTCLLFVGVMFLFIRSSFKGGARGGGGEEKKGSKKRARPSKLSQLQKFQLLTTTERKHLLMTPLPISYRI